MEFSDDIFPEELSPLSIQASKSTVSGITNEWKPNIFINQSVCGNTWHEYYIEDSIDVNGENPDCKCSSFLTPSKCSFTSKYSKLTEKYYKDTSSLKRIIKQLKSENALVHQENFQLRSDINSLQQDHSIEIQNIQARHQQKQLRTKNDIETLVKSIESKLDSSIRLQYKELIDDTGISHAKEIERIREEYEEKIGILRAEHEMEIIRIQEEEVNEREARIRKEIESEVGKKKDEEVKNIVERYEEMIKEIRREKGVRKVERKKVVEIKLENVPGAEEIRVKTEEYERHVKELQGIISNQEKIIMDMSQSLTTSFKKKPLVVQNH